MRFPLIAKLSRFLPRPKVGKVPFNDPVEMRLNEATTGLVSDSL